VRRWLDRIIMKAEANTNRFDQLAKAVVLVGFLGAGKTTLLSHLLKAERDMSGTVVIVNDFGELGIDGALVKRLDEDVIELVSGCVCCTLVVDLTITLQRILDERAPRRILIEASGLADPKGIVRVLGGEGLRERLTLHRIITILDAQCWQLRSSFGQLFANQLDNASRLVLNKIDLIERDTLQGILGEIRHELPRASVMPAVHCRIDPDAVWGGEGEAGAENGDLRAAYLTEGTRESGHGHGSGHGHDQVHADEAGYVAFAFEDEGVLDEARFREFIDALPFELFRLKGTVRFAERTDLINLVGGRGEWTEWDGEPATRLAFVGWEVDRDTILRRLEACRAAE
jgi:G3E family GTPase